MLLNTIPRMPANTYQTYNIPYQVQLLQYEPQVELCNYATTAAAAIATATASSAALITTSEGAIFESTAPIIPPPLALHIL